MRARTLGKGSLSPFLLLAVVALSLRLWVAVSSQRTLVGDESSYEEAAWSVASGQGFRMGGRPTYKAPGTSLFLAGIYRFTGRDLQAARVVQAFLTTGICLLVAGLGGLLFGRAVGLLAGWLAVFYPLFIGLTERFLSEGLYTFLLAGAWLGFALLVRAPNWRKALWVGLLCGGAALTRSVGVGIAAVFAATLLGCPLPTREAGRRKRLAWALWIGLGCGCLIVPWTARNWLRTGELIPISTEGGRAFYAGWASIQEGEKLGFNPVDEKTIQAEAIPSEVGRDRFYFAAALKELESHPEKIGPLLMLKTLFFLSPFDWEILGTGEGTYNGFFVALLPFLLFGLWKARGGSPPALWVLVPPMVYTFFISLAFTGVPRFRLPIEPGLLVLAGLGLQEIFCPQGKLHPARWGWGAGWFLAQGLATAFSTPVKGFARSALQWLGVW